MTTLHTDRIGNLLHIVIISLLCLCLWQQHLIKHEFLERQTERQAFAASLQTLAETNRKLMQERWDLIQKRFDALEKKIDRHIVANQ